MVYLQTDRQVNSGAKRGADRSGGQSHILKQLGKGLWESKARPLLCNHHTTPHAWQVDTSGLKHKHTHTQQYDLRHPILCEEGFLVCSPYFQQLCLSAQAFGAELHHRVRTKGVSDAILAERAKPQRQAALQLKGRNEDGLMTWVNTERKHPKEPWCEFTCMTNRSTKVCERVPLPCKAPQDKAQTAVWIQTDGYLARGVEFTLELDGATQRTDCCMRDLIQTHRRIINQLSRKQL